MERRFARLVLAATLIGSGIVASTPDRGVSGGSVDARTAIPTMVDGNFEFWSIANIATRVNPKTGQSEWFNLGQPGETGYVEGLEDGTGLPYKVNGYRFERSTPAGGGTELFEYSLDSGK